MLSQVSEPSSQGYRADTEASSSPEDAPDLGLTRSNSTMSEVSISEVDTYMNIDEFSSGEDDKENKDKATDNTTAANTLANARPSETSSSSSASLPLIPPTTRWMEEWEHRRTFVVKLYYKYGSFPSTSPPSSPLLLFSLSTRGTVLIYL